MLFAKTLVPDTLGLLKLLMQKPYLSDFRLVGGTALSLFFGHRISDDLDLFSATPFDTAELKAQLTQDFPQFLAQIENSNTLICIINNVKVDFIQYRYGFSFPYIEEEGIRFADINDLAPMKVDAISSRGKKKDFFDLYYLILHYSLPELLSLYQTKYKTTSLFHVIKSINYFDDAEEEKNPIVFDKRVTWIKVKKYITQQIRKKDWI